MDGGPVSFVMRKPCVRCGTEHGRIETRNGQDCVWCISCGTFQYNAPKTETGRAKRTVESVHNGIKPNQRARVLLRANGRCELCGKGTNLHVGHMISVDAGLRQGMTEAEINDDENLVALCDECNLGIGAEPMPLRFAIRVVLARIRFRKESRLEAGREA